ncbi:MAG: Fe-Mn family superoxide dismutase [Acidobacteriota bacterium]
MNTQRLYQAKQFNLSGLKGISDATLEMHFKLYEGYVKETNRLLEITDELNRVESKTDEQNVIYSEVRRRLGFEFNGMVLHEYYFDNLMKNGTGEPEKNSRFYHSAVDTFGSFEAWKGDFTRVGKMRGIGWAICFQDPLNGSLVNEWITLHEIGNLAGNRPILVMDVWEHAFLLDYKPAERPKYIEAFFSNINWQMVNDRIGEPVMIRGKSAQ